LLKKVKFLNEIETSLWTKNGPEMDQKWTKTKSLPKEPKITQKDHKPEIDKMDRNGP
jgi:hypothetical protein